MHEIKITSQSLAVLNRDVYTYFKPVPFCSLQGIPLAFRWPGWVFKFYHTVYNKQTIWTEKYTIDINGIWGKIQQIMQHILKMQYISLLS